MTRFAILISGRGSNMAAILNFWTRGSHSYPTTRSEPVVVISNRPDAPGLAVAKEAGVPTEVVDHRALGSKVAFEAELLSVLERYDVHGLVLAGFMRVLSPTVVARFPERILNVHPSLLPAFVGLDAPGQAVAAGVKVSGCTRKGAASLDCIQHHQLIEGPVQLHSLSLARSRTVRCILYPFGSGSVAEETLL